MRFVLSLASEHVSAKVFEDHWTQHYGKFTERNQTIAAKVSNFFDKYKEVNVESPYIGDTPPWLTQAPRTDDTLSKEVSKYQAPEALLALSKATIEQYTGHTRIYTDASKTIDGKVGVGCYIEAGETHTEVRLAQRITDRVTVYAGEMAAVQLALRTAIQMNESTPIVVFTDSLAVVRSVEAGQIC